MDVGLVIFSYLSWSISLHGLPASRVLLVLYYVGLPKTCQQ